MQKKLSPGHAVPLVQVGLEAKTANYATTTWVSIETKIDGKTDLLAKSSTWKDNRDLKSCCCQVLLILIPFKRKFGWKKQSLLFQFCFCFYLLSGKQAKSLIVIITGMPPNKKYLFAKTSGRKTWWARKNINNLDVSFCRLHARTNTHTNIQHTHAHTWTHITQTT